MEALLDELARARAETDQLFSLVKPEYLYERPIAERHRIVFYVGHLEAFDWNLLRDSLGAPVFDPSLDNLFAFGIDPVDGGLPSDQPADWPAEKQVSEYKHRVRDQLDRALARYGGENLEQLLHVAVEHRWMHAETLSYMLHRVPFESKRKVTQAAAATGRGGQEPVEAIRVPAGGITLGLARDAQFGWDNEFESRIIELPSFAIDRYKVTNRQFLEFLRAGGYSDRRFWTESDWLWKERQQIDRPAFWEPAGSDFHYVGIFERMPLPADWPVYVSHAEACAYAAWAGKRLPTEAEWQRAAYGTPDAERSYPWGERAPAAAHGYLGIQRWDPSPVQGFTESRSYWGVEGMLANGWEWTASLFEPFPGFEPFPFYPGYSADFFDGKHYVMKGGSPRTEQRLLRRSFRNWFQPHYQYAYAGFRCATND